MEGEKIINKWHGVALGVKNNDQDDFAVVGCSKANDSSRDQKWILDAPIGYICLFNL